MAFLGSPGLAVRAALLGWGAVGVLSLGCSTSSSPAAPADAGDDGATVSCGADPRVDAYVPNMVKASASGAVKITLVSVDPDPPIRGSNTWTIKVTDGAGSPMPNATISVAPYMPDHGHGTSIVATVMPQAGGSYSVTPLYLFMPGVWRMTFRVSVGGGDAGTDAGAVEQVAFFFCIPG